MVSIKAERKIDARDVGTPDDWVPRHPDLIRLTGRHPFNCEPPLAALKSFYTPTDLHYVRNHGAAPRTSWDTHTLKVDGLVKNSVTFSMDELTTKFQEHVVTKPVLLVCAGNRRKEQNMVKKSIGFSWGAAAAAVSNWTGVPLYILLEACGVDRNEANWVWFEGVDDLPHQSYGTCIPAHTALDPSCDVMVCWKQNGELLEPDHGFPVRIIIPGMIGGRMVKWMSRIHVSKVESNNHHHYFDNRVLPSHIDAEKATAEGWWYKPEYAIMDLNVNSALYSPAHGEELDLSKADNQYLLSGYAYTGGGRAIIRVEVSLDDGATWTLARISTEETPNAYGKYWCWVKYQVYVDTAALCDAQEVVVRAWDSSMNTQPQHLTWNVMGMMNNPWFRVKVHKKKGSNNVFHFEHPTQAGMEKGGWMTTDRVVSERSGKSSQIVQTAAESPKVVVSEINTEGLRTISTSELASHNTDKSCWFACRGLVYDATEFLDEHPGGASSILLTAGTDCTEEFEAIHSTKAWEMLKKYCIGKLEGHESGAEASIPAATETADATTEVSDVALVGNQKIPLILVSKEIQSRDTRVFKFALPAAHLRLGLPIGNHVMLYAKINGKLVIRAYTPISSEGDEDRGFISLLIKVYFANENPSFPEGGLFSQFLDNLHLGGKIEMKGPIGHFTYHNPGSYTLNSMSLTGRKLGLMAGGTGITPIYQVARAIMTNPDDTIEIAIVFAARMEEDLLLKKELEELMALKPNQMKLYCVLSNLQPGDDSPWPQGKGFINFEITRDIIGADADHVLICGPPPMIKFACEPALEKLGYSKDQLILL